MLKTGDIIAVKDNTLLAKLIRFFTRGLYTHTAIVYDVMDDYVIIGEVNWNYTYCTREMKYTNYDVYRYDGEIDCKKIQREIVKLGGTRYDFRDIFRIVFRLPMKYTPTRVICSEAIDIIYGNCGYYLNVDTKCPTPEQLVRSNRLVRIK